MYQQDPNSNQARYSSENSSPTRNWRITGDLSSWDPKDILKMPEKACIEQEEKYLSTHIPLYHATKIQNYVLDVFCRNIAKILNFQPKKFWSRGFSVTPPKNAQLITKIEDMKEKMSPSEDSSGDNLGLRDNRSKIDNSEGSAWHLLSCNPCLWQNTDRNAMESSVDFYFDNSSVMDLKFKDLFLNIFSCFDTLDSNLKDKLYGCFESLCKKMDHNNENGFGVLYQLFIRKEVIDKVAYISKDNGIVHPSHKDSTLEALMSLQSTESKIEDKNEIQVRVLLPALDQCFDMIEVVEHLDIDKTTMKEIHDDILYLVTIVYKISKSEDVEENTIKLKSLHEKLITEVECLEEHKQRKRCA